MRENMTNSNSLGAHLPDVENALLELQRRDIIARIWRGDHTVWRPEPTEITNRLGWLSVTDQMREQAPSLDSFAQEIRQAGFQHVVLLGMGGSSLGPEVLRQSFGSAPGHPELVVLDSTVPSSVQWVTETINPAHTLFLVSSKSGDTIEPLSFYKHFRGLVEQAVGRGRAGLNFAAVTDPGTSLVRLAEDQGFRRVFMNPPDIGGRYSVLSYFGLVPAALIGIDIRKLLDRADHMREGCAPPVSAYDNPGAWLGTVMGTFAKIGRDKLTIVTSPAIAGFGLWVEQLIAESTGKESKGIIPVAGEPLLAPEYYDRDRLFIYLRLLSDDNAATDSAIEKIRASGHPMMRLDLQDRYDLGAEFFRWEMATAVAGAIIGIHPFDQPNVQQAKDITGRVLRERHTAESPETGGSLTGLLSQAEPGDYLVIMAYLHQTPALDKELAELRRRVAERYRIATTLGYGPRFLHSTGQLHKGGPGSGLFLQITQDHPQDIPIPGEQYSFRTLVDAQALGDLQALKAQGRRTIRVLLGRNSIDSVRRLIDEVS